MLCSGYVPAVKVNRANPVSPPKQSMKFSAGSHVTYALSKNMATVYVNGDVDVSPPGMSACGEGILVAFAVGLLSPPRNVYCAIIRTKAQDGGEAHVCVPIERMSRGNAELDCKSLKENVTTQPLLESICQRMQATPAFINAALHVSTPVCRQA